MSFQGKLVLLFIFLFLSSAALMLFFYYEMKRAVITSVQDDIQNVVHSVHYSTQKLSSEKSPDKVFLENFIKGAKQSGGVQEISIVGSDQRIVASSNPRKVGKQHPINNQIVVVREMFGAEDSSSNHVHYQITVPIERDKKVVGVVQTHFVINDLGSTVHNFFLKDTMIAISALLLLFGVSFIALKRMNRPISLLCRASEKMARGDLSVQIPHEGSNELSKLVDAFNSMAAKINEQRLLEERYHTMERRAILAETAATLAHELRNPLNLINLTVDYVLDKFKPGEPKKEAEYTELLKNVKQEVSRLNRMVGDFLSMGKPLTLQKNRFRLREMISEVEFLLKRQIIELQGELSIVIDDDVSVYGDREQLRLVLLNLLLNAMQASGTGSKLEIEAHTAGVNSEIIVSDNGPGINDSDIKKIFEPYYSTKPDGTGLGLALAKRIVEEHGGHISARNKEEGGATFIINLPFEGETNA